MSERIKLILLINAVFIIAAVFRDFWLLIPLNLGMLWSLMNEWRNNAN